VLQPAGSQKVWTWAKTTKYPTIANKWKFNFTSCCLFTLSIQKLWKANEREK